MAAEKSTKTSKTGRGRKGAKKPAKKPAKKAAKAAKKTTGKPRLSSTKSAAGAQALPGRAVRGEE